METAELRDSRQLLETDCSTEMRLDKLFHSVLLDGSELPLSRSVDAPKARVGLEDCEKSQCLDPEGVVLFVQSD